MLGKLQQIAQQSHVSIVVILHTCRSSPGFDPDPVDDVLGSTGLTASADQVLALNAEQGKKGATLKGRGRDLDDIDLALEFDPDSGCWRLKGESVEIKVTESESEILAVLEDLGPVSANIINKALGKQYPNTLKRLSAMWIAGKIKKEVVGGKTLYFLPKIEESKEVLI